MHIKHALRQLTRRPGLSATVIVMLALGIGATTAIFSLFHQILVQPLPVPEPERLVNLSEPPPKWGSMWGSVAGDAWEHAFSYPMFRDLEAQQTVFTGIAAHLSFRANLTHREQTSAGAGMLVSGSYFRVLNLQPALGRLIGPQDEPRVGESAVVVLSHDYWQSRFGGDPDVLDRTLTVNGHALTIVGVAPPGFHGTSIGFRPQVFVPITLRWLMEPTAPSDAENRLSYWVHLFARLSPGVTVEQASAVLNRLYGGILDEVEAPLNSWMPDDVMAEFRQRQITLGAGGRGQSRIPDTAGQPITLLLGVTALVLAIVCLNVANLLLARGASRAGEMAIRASIGASRGRLVAQMLTESFLLAAIGGLASLPLAALTLDVIVGVLPLELTNELSIGLSRTAMMFAGAVSLSVVLVFGLFPAIQASEADPGHVVKGHASQSPGGRGMARFRSTLAAAQIAFSMVLLVLAGLFTQSLMNVARVDVGMEVDSIVSFAVSPGLNGYDAQRTMNLYDRIEEALAAQPAVAGAASAMAPLLAGTTRGNQVSGDGFERPPNDAGWEATNEVSPGFFAALGIPLLLGRDFTEADRLGAPNVAIVNESFVRKFGLGTDVIGRRFGIGFGERDIEIIGVVADAKYPAVKWEMPPTYYRPRRQNDNLASLNFYVRARIDAETLLAAIPAVVSSVDPNLPVTSLTTMRRQLQDDIYLDRLITMLSAGFAGLATLLAAIGLYGVLAYNVARRTRELGLRLALGAEPGRLRAMVLKQVAVTALLGGAIGLAGAIGLGRAAEALLFGLSGHDPLVLIASAAVLGAVVFAASYLPARRASNIAPMEALRYE